MNKFLSHTTEHSIKGILSAENSPTVHKPYADRLFVPLSRRKAAHSALRYANFVFPYGRTCGEKFANTRRQICMEIERCVRGKVNVRVYDVIFPFCNVRVI